MRNTFIDYRGPVTPAVQRPVTAPGGTVGQLAAFASGREPFEERLVEPVQEIAVVNGGVPQIASYVTQVAPPPPMQSPTLPPDLVQKIAAAPPPMQSPHLPNFGVSNFSIPPPPQASPVVASSRLGNGFGGAYGAAPVLQPLSEGSLIEVSAMVGPQAGLPAASPPLWAPPAFAVGAPLQTPGAGLPPPPPRTPVVATPAARSAGFFGATSTPAGTQMPANYTYGVPATPKMVWPATPF